LKDSENGLGRVALAGLKARKERMRG
jgi:hypothetical protein